MKKRATNQLNHDPNAPFLYVVAGDRDAALHTLSSAIAELLDASNRVCFKLEQEQILLAGARRAWVGEATAELDVAVRAFSDAQFSFRQVLRTTALSIGAPAESTLREVAAYSEEPWDYIFSEGAAGIRDLLSKIESHKGALRELLTRHYVAVSGALSVLGVSTPTAYDETGTLSGSRVPSVLFNQRV